ncbi:MAG: flagellar hook protein FlgE [Firmicutes bacterium]|nr:flagellar hook protein FlgE [Bacillota bacterium]
MLRSMYSGVSGLRNHQTRLDVIGNNIANVNTIGFKSGRVTFKDLFSQTLQAATSAYGDRGGSNPVQVGLGMTLASIDTNHSDGSIQYTGNGTDLAIEGSGFFIIRDGSTLMYTRAGNFDVDEEGYLVVPGSGLRVQGLDPNVDGRLVDIRISTGETYDPVATTKVEFANNLDYNARGEGGNPPVVPATFEVYDSLGNLHTVEIEFTKVPSANAWQWQIISPTGTEINDSDGNPVANLTLSFDEAGKLIGSGEFILQWQPADAEELNIEINFSAVTGAARQSTLAVAYRNGAPQGSLQSYSIDGSGTIIGEFSNGLIQDLGQVALARFANPGGLMKVGNTAFMESNNSGIRQIGRAGTAGFGSIASSSLEMSNVDLSLEFTEMIVTQRGLQANSRIITTSDEVLQEVVNLKR